MAQFPADNAYTENGITQGERRQRHTDQLLATKQLWGAAGEESLTIAIGIVTPSRGTVVVDTEAAASSDDLTHIGTANIPNGGIVAIRIADNGRAVNVVSNAGGAGEIVLAGGLNLQLNRTEQTLFVQRRGTVFQEVQRTGREKVHIVGAAGEPAFLNGWLSGLFGARYWKDNSGVVQLSGTLSNSSLSGISSDMLALPVGYRPTATATIRIPVQATVAGQLEVNIIQIVWNTGILTWQRAAGLPGVSVVSIDLSAVSFRADA